MEGEVRRLSFQLQILLLGASLMAGQARAQEAGSAPAGAETAEINLRKSVVVREFQGREISGEERQIGRGDSLWRILIEEKGLPERRFRSDLVVIRGLNPQVKNLDVLRAGDKIFIPLRLEDANESAPRTDSAAAAGRPGSGSTVNYQVKAGEHLYRILRDRYKSADERKLAQYYALVKDLNPQRKDWDSLLEGEIIRLPADQSPEPAKAEGTKPRFAATPQAPAPVVVAEPAPKPRSAPPKPFDVGRTMRSPARDNMQLFVQIAEAAGNEVELIGEEVVKLPDGTLRLDRSAFPVIYNASIGQRVVVDPEGKIPASVKTKLNDPRVGTPVLPMANGLSIADAVRQLLISIGYQPLPADRPVVVQEAGVTFEAKGNWMALAPVVSNKPQEVLVINVTQQPNEIPEYLTAELAKQGLRFRDVVLAREGSSIAPPRTQSQFSNSGPAKELPKDKREIIDALLLSFQVPFGVAENIAVELRDGLRLETQLDRVFELEGKRTAILFRPIDPLMRQALQDNHAINTVELDIPSLSSRELIARMLGLLGDPAVYGEHRFAAAEDKLTLKAWGFNLKKKSMFLTDRQIPPVLHRFFFEKGFDIIYFR